MILSVIVQGHAMMIPLMKRCFRLLRLLRDTTFHREWSELSFAQSAKQSKKMRMRVYFALLAGKDCNRRENKLE